MDADIESLKNAMAKLRALLFVLFALLAVFIALLFFRAADSHGVVSASAFRLVNAEDNVLAELVSRDGYPGLYLLDENGVQRIAVFHEPDTSGIYINDDESHTRIGIAQFSHGGGGVALHGPQSKGAAVLYLKNEGSLRFFDADGQVSRDIRATPLAE